MKLHIVRDAKDHNLLTVHLDVDLEKHRAKPDKDVWSDDERFSDFDDYPADVATIFRKHLLQIKGVQGVRFDKYSIDIVKGRVFEWKVLIRQIRASLELDLNHGNSARCTGAYCGSKERKKREIGASKERIPG